MFYLFTGKPPHIIPKSVMDTVKIHDGIGYAPNPHYKRGAPKVSVHVNSIPYILKYPITTQLPTDHHPN